MNEKRKNRRHWTHDLPTVFDRETGRPFAKLGNLSSDGAMFITPEPAKSGQCRPELPLPIMDHCEALFDAECGWREKNKTSGRHESDYHLKSVSKPEAEIISYLILGSVIDEWSCPDTGSEPIAHKPFSN